MLNFGLRRIMNMVALRGMLHSNIRNINLASQLYIMYNICHLS